MTSIPMSGVPRANFGAVCLFFLASAVSAGEHPITFKATPINCEGGHTGEVTELANAGGQSLAWVDEHTLHVESIQDLDSYAEVIPDSGTMDDSAPGKLLFHYTYKDPGPAPGQPYDMCGQLFIFEFDVTGLARAEYSVSIVGSEVK